MASPGSANYFSLLDNDNGPAQKKRHRIMIDREYPELTTPRPTKQTQDEPKYITITAAEQNKTLDEYNEFVVKKGVESVSRLYSKATYLRDGSLLLLCDNGNVADRFIKTNKIAGIPVKITMNDRLNSPKGTVYARNMTKRTEAEILEGLQDQGVTEVVQIKRTVDGQSVPTGLLILTFQSFKQPSHIYLGFLRAEVREYIPNPMRCRKCQLIGHTQKWCKSEEEICETCAVKKPHDSPCKAKYCVNCKKPDHTSNDPKCPVYARFKEYNKIRVQRRCTLYEAKQYFFKMNPGEARVQPTYAQAMQMTTTEQTNPAPTNQQKEIQTNIQKKQPTKINTETKQTTANTTVTANTTATATRTVEKTAQKQIDLTKDDPTPSLKPQQIQKEHKNETNNEENTTNNTTQNHTFDFGKIFSISGEKTAQTKEQPKNKNKNQKTTQKQTNTANKQTIQTKQTLPLPEEDIMEADD